MRGVSPGTECQANLIQYLEVLWSEQIACQDDDVGNQWPQRKSEQAIYDVISIHI